MRVRDESEERRERSVFTVESVGENVKQEKRGRRLEKEGEGEVRGEGVRGEGARDHTTKGTCIVLLWYSVTAKYIWRTISQDSLQNCKTSFCLVCSYENAIPRYGVIIHD